MSPEPLKTGNRLLARLPQTTFARLSDQLKPLSLEVGEVLYEAKAVMDYAYFPMQGTVSAVVVMLDGRMVEVATVGNEGAIGVPLLNSNEVSPNRVFVQVAGDGVSIKSKVLEAEIMRSPALRQLLVRYHTAFDFQVSQSVACNGLHKIQERCCRWLLMTHDRVYGDDIILAQEFLATMLGVRRASVTAVLQSIQEKGLIQTSHRRIRVMDRKRLEAESCECYGTVRDEYVRLLG